MFSFVIQSWKRLSPKQRARMRMIIGVFSDGMNNSAVDPEARAEFEPFVADLRGLGWELQAYGIGPLAGYLTETLYFDPALATEVRATSTGILSASECLSESIVPNRRDK